MLKKMAALVSVPLLALSLTACSSGASKEEVTKGMAKAKQSEWSAKGLVDLDPQIFDDYAKCIIDQSYDDFSASTRDIIADGDYKAIAEAQVSQEEFDALEKAVKDCDEDFVKALMQ